VAAEMKQEEGKLIITSDLKVKFQENELTGGKLKRSNYLDIIEIEKTEESYNSS